MNVINTIYILLFRNPVTVKIVDKIVEFYPKKKEVNYSIKL